MPNKYSSDGTPLVGRQKLRLGRTSFKRTDTGSEVMGVDGRPAGVAEIIWDGDTSAWTRSGVGTVTTESAYMGTYGLDSTLVGANNQSVFDNGSELDVAGIYDVLSFWLQPKAYPGNAVMQLQWHNAQGTTIGSTLLVESYVTNMDLDVWQHVSVPIADFNLTSDVQQLWVVYKVGTQRHWVDDAHLDASGGGGPYTFRVSAEVGAVYHVERLVLTVAAGESGWSSASFADVVGGLENGVLLKCHRIGAEPETYWTVNARTNMELCGQYGSYREVVFSDGEMLMGFSLEPGLASILLGSDEVLDFIVRDDLSPLTMRAFLHYGVEVVEV